MTELSELPGGDAAHRAGPSTYVVRTLIVLAAVVVLAVIGVFLRDRLLSTERLFELADEALDQSPQPDYETAERYLRRILDRDPDSNRANLMMAVALVQRDRIDEALEYTERIPDDFSRESVRARCFAGSLLLDDQRQPFAALAQFERAFAQDSGDATANSFLSHVHRLGVLTLNAQPYSVFLAKNGQLSPQQLFELSLGHEVRAASGLVSTYSQAAPDDPLVLLGQADVALQNGDTDRAEELFRRVIRDHPEMVGAHVRLGQVLLQAGEADGFLAWHRGLPDEAERHPLTWSFRGNRAEELAEQDVAIRCYWEAVRVDPNHLPAVYRLGQLLTAEGRDEDAAPFLQRAHLLELYSLQCRSLILLTDREQPDLEGMYSAAMLAGELGLLAEANAWIKLILQADSTNENALRVDLNLRDLMNQVAGERAVGDVNPAAHIDLSGFPLPDWTSTPDSLNPPPVAPAIVTFQDQAADAGLDFQFFKGGDPDVQGLSRAWCTNGGGVAILDLDCDGWPDIHLTQGADFDEQPGAGTYFDQLYRNSGGRFANVTDPARIAEDRYSQGATVGDFNGDGFPDLYVANIGRNRLYLNNGDGTFDDISESAGLAGSMWTSSCLLADLNGDALPDLYDVNYLFGPDIFTTVCRDAEGRKHSCQPLQFAPGQDELSVNRGDGTFSDVTDESGIVAFNGRGLGIVAGNFDGTGRLNLFIANTDTDNFYFVNTTGDHARIPRFTDEAMPTGLACNRNGHAEACRGVAAGDVDHDGQLELFVANSWNETNTLYDWQPGDLFMDVTQFTGLTEPGQSQFGFGAQFIDGALRGSLDLIVANGHTDRYDLPGVPYEIPPRYYSNVGDGRFAALEAAALGPYFEGAYLGRAVARTDWNRDGREDLVVLHLDAPAALLTNTTGSVGRHIAVRLIGTQSARDAVGTTLTLMTSDGRTLTRQLTAGDGFQASNQRIVVFGLGDADGVDELRVRWPSGIEQQFTDILPDREYTCAEGLDRLVPMRRPQPTD